MAKPHRAAVRGTSHFTKHAHTMTSRPLPFSAGHDRHHKSPWKLMRQAAGTRDQVISKLKHLRRVGLAYTDTEAVSRRLERLSRQSTIDTTPTPLQLLCGSIDMLRFWITPSARDYYRSQGINFTFHQLLRFLDDPGSMTDPLGLASTRDTIIGHLLQVVHANPRYDLELLSSFPGGLEALERQLLSMIARTHPRAATIAAVVEDPSYFERLLTYVRAFRHDPSAPAPVRDNVRQSADLSEREETFGSLASSMRYMSTLPTTWRGVVRHVLTVTRFPSAAVTSGNTTSEG